MADAADQTVLGVSVSQRIYDGVDEDAGQIIDDYGSTAGRQVGQGKDG